MTEMKTGDLIQIDGGYDIWVLDHFDHTSDGPQIVTLRFLKNEDVKIQIDAEHCKVAFTVDAQKIWIPV